MTVRPLHWGEVVHALLTRGCAGSSDAPASRARCLMRAPASVLLVVAVSCAVMDLAWAQAWKAHDVPLLVSAAHPSGRDGLVRVVNRTGEAGEVVIEAFDDDGVGYGPVTLSIGAQETVHLGSGDLEEGNPDKGLSGGLGAGMGEWRLRLRSELALEVLAYSRTGDGLVAPVHARVPRTVVRRPSTGEEAMGHGVAMFNPFNPASSGAVSWLRLVNPGDVRAAVVIEGIDDAGESPGPGVSLEIPPGAARTVTSQALESGEGAGLSGMLADGQGRWRLVVTADQPIEVMSLLRSPTGHLVNLSTAPEVDEGDDARAHDVALFVSADNPHHRQGLVRVVNRTGEAGEVAIEAFDDDGMGYGPVTLSIGAQETVHLGSGDLEEGNPDKGLSGGLGAGAGEWWRLRLRSALALEVLAYSRTDDGLVAPVHARVPRTVVRRPSTGEEAMGHGVALFNPASSGAVSWLRLVNPGDVRAAVFIEGIDDAGESPGPGVSLEIPPGAARTVTSQALESGEGAGLSGMLADGQGRWRLVVTADQPIEVMSLLTSPSGDLVNLSTAALVAVAVAPPVASGFAGIDIVGQTTARTGTAVTLRVRRVGARDVVVERYEWELSDGRRESGEEVSVHFVGAGMHEVTVRAMRGDEEVAQAVSAVSVFDAEMGANPGLEGIPRVFGDVDTDGRFGPEDVALAERALAGGEVLGSEAIEAGDLNLSGVLDAHDVELMRAALGAGEALPSALLDASAYPGGVVAMVSPVLGDADAVIGVFVDGEPAPQVMRAILGYATFVVPAALAGRDGEVEVVVEADGVVGERLALRLESVVTPGVDAREDIRAFFAELAQVVAEQERAGAAFVAQLEGLTDDDTAIVLGAAKAGAMQLEEARRQIEALLGAEGGEELATMLQAALYASGLAEFRAALQEADPLHASGLPEGHAGPRMSVEGAGAEGGGARVSRSVAAVCDVYVPKVCNFKKASAQLSTGLDVAAGLCAATWAAGGLAALTGVGAPAGATYIADIAEVCLPMYAGLKVAELPGLLVEAVTVDMRLKASPMALQGDREVTVTAEVTFAGLQHLCVTGGTKATGYAGDVAGSIRKKLTLALLRQGREFRVVQRILKRALGEDRAEKFIEDIVGKGVDKTLTLIGIDHGFDALAGGVCGLLGGGQVTEDKLAPGLTADGSRFDLQAWTGTRRLSASEFGPKNDGTGTWRLACPRGFAGTLEVRGSKTLCGERKERVVKVSCECDTSAEEVDIPDPALRRVVEEALGRAPGTPITPAEMATLVELEAGGIWSIRSLKGLECATGLEVLDLSGNQLTQVSLPDELPALEELWLGNNQLTQVSLPDELPALEELWLGNNQLTQVSLPDELPALEELWLGNNQLTQVSLPDELPALEELWLGNNQLTQVSLPDELPALEELWLGNNQLTQVSLPDELPALKELSLGNNQLTQVSLSGLPALEGLGLYENQLTQVSLSGLPALKELDIGENQLTQVSLSGLPALKELDLYDNQLTRVSLSGLPALEWLYLERNQLTQVSLSGLPALKGLELQNNQLTQVSLSGLPALGTLVLNDNHLTQVSLSGLPALEELDLNDNQLTQVSLSELPALEGLYLDNNQLTQMSLSGLPALKWLSLDSNQLTQVSSLPGLPALEELDLQNNRIRNIGFLVHHAGLDYVDLYGNPLDRRSCSVLIPILEDRDVRVRYNHQYCDAISQ